MSEASDSGTGFFGWLGNILERRSGWVIATTLMITLLLLLPLVMMAPTEMASDTPAGNAMVKLHDHIEDVFPQELFFTGFIVEAKDGDMLTRRNLYELYEREQALRGSNLSGFLYTRYDEAAGSTIEGTYTLADAVNTVLLLQSGDTVDLSSDAVPDTQVKQVVDFLFNNPDTEDLRESLSAEAGRHDDGLWASPALIVSVFADDELVLEEYLSGDREDAPTQRKDKARERFAREVQEIMRSDQQENETLGIAIDLNLEIEDEGKISAILLMIAMVLVAVLILVIFRSWFIMLVTTVGLGMLIVWLKGFANLIGLKSSVTLDLIVPITIVVLGVDYAIQALFRYRQERDKGALPHQAIGDSTCRVGRALVLAMLTTVVAFISNASAGIESVVGFAIAASFAIFASFLLLGLFVPAVNMRWQARKSHDAAQAMAAADVTSRGGRLDSFVSGVSDRWLVALPVILIVTGFAAWGWLNVETKFDAKDALRPDSDFVVSLDKWDEHGADKGGEPSLLYFEGDFTQHQALDAIRTTIDEMNNNQYVGRSPIDNKPNPYVLLLDLLEVVAENNYAKAQIQTASGLEITDLDSDLIPDTSEQLVAVYDYVLTNGLPQDENTMRFNRRQITERFVLLGPSNYATLMSIGVPGTREQEIVRLASDELNEDLDVAVGAVESIRDHGLTGTGHVRVAQFDAISESLTNSLTIAVVAVMLMLLAIFRSLRYAVVTIIPVLMVACWLYGFMYAAGYSLNMLTATIAAISIGVGIDFSIHYTERFREELEATRDKKTALRKTTQTTGLALFSTALTTVIGFTVIAFAPMPMFSTFGVLTAIMIALSLFMALFALPSLLLLFAPDPSKSKG